VLIDANAIRDELPDAVAVEDAAVLPFTVGAFRIGSDQAS
jgi:hypothetical protein